MSLDQRLQDSQCSPQVHCETLYPLVRRLVKIDSRAHTVDFLHVIHERETIILTEGPALPFGGTRDMGGLCGVVERVNKILAITCGTTIVVSLESSSMTPEKEKVLLTPLF